MKKLFISALLIVLGTMTCFAQNETAEALRNYSFK